MNENPETESDDSVSGPELRTSRRFSLVWVIPILAIVLGGWLVYRHIQSQGPVIEVRFVLADGIQAGKTEVRTRSVKIGTVEDVRLAENFNGVVVKIRLSPKAADLARLDSRFWVVRPRVTGANISGLGTIISGTYIAMEPGPSEEAARDFVGLEEPPVTPAGVPGLRLDLMAPHGGQAGVGSPVLFDGNTVGTIERRRFNPKTREVELRAFVFAKYSELVTENARFWDESGVQVTAGAEGFKLDLPSLETILAGGVTFGVPEGVDPGPRALDDSQFELYPDELSAVESVFESGGEFLLLFDSSVRGLVEGSKVEFRGLQVGRVAGISFLYSDEPESRRVPVLVQLNQKLIEKQFPASMRDEGGEGMVRAIEGGLRGALRPTNLLTGQLFVDLDFYEDVKPAAIAQVGEYPVLPTVETGLARLEEQIAAVLTKLEQLPLEESLAKINGAVEQTSKTLAAAEKTFARGEGALVEARDSLEAVRKVLENPNMAKLPGEVRETLVALRTSIDGVGPKSSVYGDLRRTMDELRGAARSIERVANTIEEKPNSLVFGKGLKKEVIPRAIPTR